MNNEIYDRIRRNIIMSYENNTPTNTSGQGKNAVVPETVKNRFNWGAFLLSWIWGIGNNSYIAFLTFVLYFIPVIGCFLSFLFCIVLGIKGNELAWQNKKFESIEAFHTNQKKWAKAGLIVYAIIFVNVLLIAALTIPKLSESVNQAQEQSSIRFRASSFQNAAYMLKVSGAKCKLTSVGLAECFSPELNAASATDNKLTFEDGTEFIFTGNKRCVAETDCNVTIKNGSSEAVIPIYADRNGNVTVKREDVQKYIVPASTSRK